MDFCDMVGWRLFGRCGVRLTYAMTLMLVLVMVRRMGCRLVGGGLAMAGGAAWPRRSDVRIVCCG